MNYRHAYHAGNFADVLKHAVLASVLAYMKRKDAPFRVIDTHAGVGLYDLAGEEAGKTGEWRSGIGRLVGPDALPMTDEVAAILAPYLDVVRALNPDGIVRSYPGSPGLALALLRPQDRLIANELHPEDAQALRAALGRDRRAKVLTFDGWVALKALLPPKERRGVVLIDPPFEQPGELDRMAQGMAQAVRRFATGVYLLWYPIKDPAPVERFVTALAHLQLPRLLNVELMVEAPQQPARLSGCGLAIVNAPHALAGELEILLPDLVGRLAVGAGARGRVVTIT